MFNNTETQYGVVSIVLHWLSFLLVAALFGVGLYMVDLTYYDPLYHELPQWHKLFGVVLAVLSLARILWRILSRSPTLLAAAGWQVAAARSVHWALYLLLLLLPLTGYLISTAEGSDLSAFGWTLLPGLFELSPALADWAGSLHLWTAWGLIGLATVHALAAFKHHFVDRDSTLIRMVYIKGQ